MSSFDKDRGYKAESNSFTAVITPGTFTWRAVVTWKKRPQAKPPADRSDSWAGRSRLADRLRGGEVITSPTEEQLRARLRLLDPSVIFTVATQATSVDTTDGDSLEAMRVDPAVRDIAYLNACRRLGAEPQQRPDFTPKPAVVKETPYSPEELNRINQGVLLTFLKEEHPELVEDINGDDYNLRVLLEWHRLERINVLTCATLGQAYSECSVLNFFRTHVSGMRDFARLQTRVFDWNQILALRAEKAASAHPAPETMVVPDGSPAARAEKLRLERLAANHVRQSHPGLSEASGEFRKAVDAVIRSWAVGQNANLGRPKTQATAPVPITITSRA